MQLGREYDRVSGFSVSFSVINSNFTGQWSLLGIIGKSFVYSDTQYAYLKKK